MDSGYRSLSTEDVERLENQGCRCSDWSKVQVADGFDTSKVKTTTFSGEIKLGIFDRDVCFFGGVHKASGIR